MDKRKKIFTTPEKAAFRGNYFKLWINERVNFPFIVRLAAIQKPRGLPLKGGDEKFEENMRLFFKKIKKEEQEFFESQDFSEIAPLINEITKRGLPKEKVKPAIESLFDDKFPWLKFQSEIKSLAKEFGFDERWIPYLTDYVITGVITAPHDRLDGDAPPENILEDWGIFNLTAKMKAQHSFLKKQGYKNSRRSKSSEKTENKYISEQENMTGEGIPDNLIHSYLEVSQLVWPEADFDKLSDDELAAFDKKRGNLTRQRLSRFIKKYCVSATDDDIALLRSLPKTT